MNSLEDKGKINKNILATLCNAFVMTDLQGKLTFTNDYFLKLWGYNDYQEVLGKTTEIFWQMEEPLSEVICILEKNGLYMKNVIAKKRDGAEFKTQISLNLVRDKQGNPLHMAVLILDSPKPESFNKEVLQISERVEQRIAEDLHDSIGQILTGMSFLSKGLEKDLASKEPGGAKKVAELTKLVNKAIEQVRCITSILNPLKLGRGAYALVEALQEFVDNINQLFGISCILYCNSPEPIFNNSITKHFYCIVRESVNNAIRHGKAKNILIRLISQKNRTVIVIQDDGIGIPTLSKDHKGMGLNIMKHRAQLIGASLTIKRRRQGGTIIICCVKHNREIKK